jgi:2-oxoglutarate ferredoxin oxidoreductase subunit alpha
VWPFPEKQIRDLARKVRAFVVPEINMGQIVREVERCAAGQALVLGAHRAGGDILEPERVLDKIRQAAGVTPATPGLAPERRERPTSSRRGEEE